MTVEPPSRSGLTVTGAACLTGLYALAVLALLPVAGHPGPVIPAITPAFAAVTLATELPTSFLLFARFRATGAWAALPLGCAYLFGGAMAVLHALTFPGAILAEGPVLGTAQSAAWAYLLWLDGFGALALAAAMLAALAPGRRAPPGHAGWIAALAGLATLALVLATAVLITAFAPALPPLLQGGAWTGLNQALALLAFGELGLGIALSLFWAGRRDPLFRWLALALTGLLAANLLSQAGGGRYTVGWSTGRLSWLISASVLFLVFLADAARQTRRLAEARDLLERRVAERTADLARALEDRTNLLRELDHRAKNALAAVQSVVRLTRAEQARDFARTVEGRIGALVRAHTLLADEAWSGGCLRTLVAAELLAAKARERATLSGPAVRLTPEAVQPLALTLHELSTNALRHGALSVPDGSVAVSWAAVEGGGVVLSWAEAGGPPVPGPPGRPGLGLALVTRSVRAQLGGTVAFDWRPEGLSIAVPIAANRIAAAAASPILAERVAAE